MPALARDEQTRLERIFRDLRERLLDLSARNPMLSYKHRASSKRQLQIVNANPNEVYRRLVMDDDALELLPLPDLPNIPVDEKTSEFRAALPRAKTLDIEYLTEIQALENTGPGR